MPRRPELARAKFPSHQGLTLYRMRAYQTSQQTTRQFKTGMQLTSTDPELTRFKCSKEKRAKPKHLCQEGQLMQHYRWLEKDDYI